MIGTRPEAVRRYEAFVKAAGCDVMKVNRYLWSGKHEGKTDAEIIEELKMTQNPHTHEGGGDDE